MTMGGLLVWLISWGIILFLSGYTVFRTLRADKEQIHAPLEIEDEDLGTVEENHPHRH